MQRINPRFYLFPVLQYQFDTLEVSSIRSIGDKRVVMDGYLRGLLDFLKVQQEERNCRKLQQSAKRFLVLLLFSLAMVFLFALAVLAHID
jgi:hypothetical protein